MLEPGAFGMGACERVNPASRAHASRRVHALLNRGPTSLRAAGPYLHGGGSEPGGLQQASPDISCGVRTRRKKTKLVPKQNL